MGLVEFSIKRYQFTIVACIMLAALGLSSISNIPRSEDPLFDYAAFSISAVLPGFEPQDMEQLVAKPLEDRISALDDFRKVETQVSDGVAVLTIYFYSVIDPERKYDELVREINALRPELPAELSRLTVRRINPGLVNIVQYALVGDDASYIELEDQARRLKDLLQTVDGVRNAATWAYPARELRVALDLRRMGEMKLTAGQVAQALQSENANIPAGTVDVGARSFSVKTTGGYQSLDQVRDTVIASEDRRVVRVRDIAAVSWANQPETYVGRYNGRRAVFVTANQKEGYDIFETRDAIVAAASRFERQLPKRIQLELGFDQSLNVADRLGRLTLDFAIAISLVLVFLLPLGLRAAAVVMVSLPLSLAIGITVIKFLGYSLNQVSIAGFVLALGLLVDDSIVVVENIARHLREGQTRTTAALLATKQIAPAVLGCTATLMFAFLPLVMLPGDAGKFIRPLPVAVLSTIAASLLVSLTIIPFIASRMLAAREAPQGNRILQWVMNGIQRSYRPVLQRALAHPRLTVAFCLLGCLLITVPVARSIGFSLFPKADAPYFLVTVRTPDGSSLAETDRALRFAEAQVAALPQLSNYFSNLGRGNPQVYYNVYPRDESTSYAEILVRLKSYDQRRTPRQLDALRAQLAQYANARINVTEFQNGPGDSAPVAIRLIGDDVDELHRLAASVEKILASTPGIYDVDNPVRIKRTNLQLSFDSRKAALLGVPTVEFDRAVRLSISGLAVGKYQQPNGEQYDIVLRSPLSGRADLNALSTTRVTQNNGSVLPLSQLARLEFATAPPQINRYNRQRAVVLGAQVKNGYNTAKVTAAVLQRLDQIKLPSGYSFLPGGEFESGRENFGDLGSALIIAVLGIVAILVLEFGNFKSTLIVLTVVPFGVAGGVAMLALSGNSISFIATVGFIALIGIEIKNSLLLVDFTNRLRAQGMELNAAIERAGEVRFLPILLTSATAGAGLLPLALQNQGLYSPMAWVIIGGLVASTLVARVVTPAIYKIIPPTIEVQASGKQPLDGATSMPLEASAQGWGRNVSFEESDPRSGADRNDGSKPRLAATRSDVV